MLSTRNAELFGLNLETHSAILRVLEELKAAEIEIEHCKADMLNITAPETLIRLQNVIEFEKTNIKLIWSGLMASGFAAVA